MTRQALRLGIRCLDVERTFPIEGQGRGGGIALPRRKTTTSVSSSGSVSECGVMSLTWNSCTRNVELKNAQVKVAPQAMASSWLRADEVTKPNGDTEELSRIHETNRKETEGRGLAQQW